MPLFSSSQPCMGRGSQLHLQELSTAGNVEVPETCWCRLGQSRDRAFLRQPLGLAASLQKLCTAGDQQGLDRGLPPYAGWGTAETESSRSSSAGWQLGCRSCAMQGPAAPGREAAGGQRLQICCRRSDCVQGTFTSRGWTEGHGSHPTVEGQRCFRRLAQHAIGNIDGCSEAELLLKAGADTGSQQPSTAVVWCHAEKPALEAAQCSGWLTA